MQRAIKIGVTYTGTDEKHTNYVNWLKGDDDLEIVLLSPEETDLDTIKDFDGIVLSGGIDMHPRFYHNDIADYPNAPEEFHEERDEFEIALFKISQQTNLPVLGVCRGMQLVNCVLGGTLIQDIGPVSNAIHKFDRTDKAHGINIKDGSLLHELLGAGRMVTNSAHHQAIKELGNGLVANCTSDDGIVEGLEWSDKKDKPFFVGIQWHPERMYKLSLGNSPVAKNLRDRFINEIKKITDHS